MTRRLSKGKQSGKSISQVYNRLTLLNIIVPRFTITASDLFAFTHLLYIYYNLICPIGDLIYSYKSFCIIIEKTFGFAAYKTK